MADSEPARPPHLPIVGLAVPMVLAEQWEAIQNMTRWTDSLPVPEVRDFVRRLPGTPVPPAPDDYERDVIALADSGQELTVLMPVQIEGAHREAGFVLRLSLWGRDWLWGFGRPQLLNDADLEALRGVYWLDRAG